MELEHSIWQIGFIALIAGAMIGVLIYRFFTPSIKELDEVQSELADARAELGKYKADVSQHFDKTADLVNDLAQNYVRVYQHLAQGADTLGASKSFKDLIGQDQAKPAIASDVQIEPENIEDINLAQDIDQQKDK